MMPSKKQQVKTLNLFYALKTFLLGFVAIFVGALSFIINLLVLLFVSIIYVFSNKEGKKQRGNVIKNMVKIG